VVRFTDLFLWAPGAQAQVAESQQARHLVEALRGGQLICSAGIRHGRRSERHFVTALACQNTIGWMQIQIKQAFTEVERKQK
jgi:hypothetical protein